MSIKIELYPSGLAFTAEEELTILDSALNQNINIEYSCKDGTCGACKSRLINGTVDSLSSTALSSDEIANGYILTCCSKPKSNLILEADYHPQLDGIVKKTFPCKVSSLEFPVDDVAVLKLRIPPTTKLNYLSGQYLDLTFNGIRRSYSIANMCSDFIELHIRKVENGKFSQFLFNELKENSLLRAEGPMGTFFVRENHNPIIFLAGGTGFAPVKAMIEKLLDQNDSRDIYVYWGMAKEGHFYSDIALQWSQKYNHIHYVPVVSEPNGTWNGRSGLVHQAVMDDFKDLSKFNVYACGNPMMIESARKDFISIGLLEKQFFSDAFVPSTK